MNKESTKKKFILASTITVLALLLLVLGVVLILKKSSGSARVSPQISENKTSGKSISESTTPKKSEESTPSSANSDDTVKKDSNIVLSAVGDCTIGTDAKFNKSTSLPVIVQKNNNDLNYLFRNVSSVFKSDDITIANLETTFTNSTNIRDKKAGVQYSFKGDPELAKALVLASIEGVNVSNNHIYDFGNEGFNDTLNTLKANNIAYFGEGNQWIKEVKGIKFGFLGYQGWSADSSMLKKIKSDISSLKSKTDIVIVTFHWGTERMYTPNETQKKLAHYSVDCGADLIIGHHPHVIQGIEKYKDKFICYSLGNFCFGGNSNPPDKDTFILQADFKFNGNKLNAVGIKAIPCSISSVASYNDYRPTPMNGNNKTRLLKKLNGYCINLGFELGDDFSYVNIE